MKRKVLIILVVLAAIAALFFYFNQGEKTPFFKETSMYRAVPVSVAVFAEINSIKSLPLDNPALKQWLEVKQINRFIQWVHKLDSVIKSEGKIQNALRTDKFILALDFIGDKNLTPLVVQNAESNNRKKSLGNLVRAMFPESSHLYSEIEYNGYKITSAVSGDYKSQLHYSFADGLFIASSNLVLVQQSLLQLTEPGLTSDSQFRQLTNSIDSEPEMGWYVNQGLFPDIVSEWFNSSSIALINEFKETVKHNHYRNIRNLNRFAAWNFFNTEVDDENVLLKGITVSNDSVNHFLSVFNGQNPRRSGAADILPKNTAFFTSYMLSNKELFFKRLEKYFLLSGTYYKREDLIQKMENNFRVDFRKTMQAIVNNEIMIAVSTIPAEISKKTTFLILETESKSKTTEKLDSLILNYASRNNQSIDEYKNVFSVNEKTHYTIVHFPYPSFPGIWLGKPFTAVQANYAVQFQDYLIFCNTENGLQNYLMNIIEEGSLAKDNRFKNATEKNETRSNIIAYLNVRQSINLSSEIFNSEIARKLEKNRALVRNFQAASLQISGNNKIFNTEINLLFDDGNPENDENENVAGASPERGDAQTLWQCSIGNAPIVKPVFTINHGDKENREVMVQDKANKLYQISHTGAIRWNKNVGEPIMSEIYQIDYLANGKLQYLFSTKNKLFIIDRNGENLEGFPLSFPAVATAGVSVFDYENNRIYRYFVPCNNKKIYAYNKNGKLIEGWKFEGTKSKVTTPIQHFRVNGTDYIVFKDEKQVYIQNRRGEAVAKPGNEFRNSRSPLTLISAGTPRLPATDVNGNLYLIGFDGNFSELKLPKCSDEHFFSTDDLNGDGKPEFIFVDGKTLTVFHENGTLSFTQKFANTIQYPPSTYKFSSKEKKIGIVDEKSNRIYLFGHTGKQHSGFPLQGNSEFSIGRTTRNSKKLNLITATKGGSLYCYILE